ncbi:type IV secretion system protein, partial [Pseudomonas savastanoi]|uniref:type IV secretion system protein n=1 Tax=Pseudomonas savastanoi TaxID=29438 RepID=UPI001F2AC9B5
DDGFVPLTGWGARNMIWLGSGVLMTVTALVFLVADVTIALLSITAPLFIFCLMFGFLRTMFLVATDFLQYFDCVVCLVDRQHQHGLYERHDDAG